MCQTCWPHTSGPCQMHTTVCHDFFPGTTMCPPGTFECGVSGSMTSLPLAAASLHVEGVSALELGQHQDVLVHQLAQALSVQTMQFGFSVEDNQVVVDALVDVPRVANLPDASVVGVTIVLPPTITDRVESSMEQLLRAAATDQVMADALSDSTNGDVQAVFLVGDVQTIDGATGSDIPVIPATPGSNGQEDEGATEAAEEALDPVVNYAIIGGLVAGVVAVAALGVVWYRRSQTTSSSPVQPMSQAVKPNPNPLSRESRVNPSSHDRSFTRLAGLQPKKSWVEK